MIREGAVGGEDECAARTKDAVGLKEVVAGVGDVFQDLGGEDEVEVRGDGWREAAVGGDGEVDGAFGRRQQGGVEQLAARVHAGIHAGEGVRLVAMGLRKRGASGKSQRKAGQQQTAARQHQLNPKNKTSLDCLSILRGASFGRACGSNVAAGLAASAYEAGENTALPAW